MTKTQICNMAMLKIGQTIFTDVDTDGTPTSLKCVAAYSPVLEEALTTGPQKGWKFARRRNRISVDSITITAFASASATTTTVTGTHALVAGDIVVIEDTTNYDGEYEVVSVSTTVSFVITKAYVADDATGTAKWTSDSYEYRFPLPTMLRLVSVTVGGAELTDWIREGAYILTNQESDELDIQYVQSITTESLFPSHFAKVFYMMLAYHLSFDIVQSKEHSNAVFEELYGQVMPKAMALDEQEQYVEEESHSWVEAGR